MAIIALIGLMGAGKSTVGRALAEALDLGFVDTDDLISQVSGASIQHIFAEKGEEQLRRFEEDVLRAALSEPDRVVACGGGSVLRKTNRKTLKSADFIVYIRVPVEVAAARVGDGKGRPLISAGQVPTQLSTLLSEREPLYEQMADIVVDGSAEVEEVVARIVEAVRG